MTKTSKSLRNNTEMATSEWTDLEEVGYVRLGRVLADSEIDQLCERIDQIMLGEVYYDGMDMQLCPSASRNKELITMSAVHKGSSLKYRKIQDLEMDPLFLRYIQHPLFRDITRKKIGGEVGVFRSMFFNKPSGGGIPKNWHQDGGDWDLSVPEEITVYTALDPQTSKNGCLRVIPYSHKECPIASVSREADIKKYAPEEKCICLEMERGEVILFKNKLLHSSLANTTDFPRRALSVAYIHADAYSLTCGKRFPQVFPKYRSVEK